MSTEASLYVHVPFCANRKCDYCDFHSIPVKPGDIRLLRFVETLLLEAGRVFEEYRPARIPTVYIGGGTPSVLGPAGISRLLRGLAEQCARFSSSAPDEITVEANPESADEAFLAAARDGGVTRLSLGVQSFSGPSRRAVRRAGNETLLPGRLRLCSEYFPGAFSADLISGLPLQDEKVLLDDIAALVNFSPAHISLYALTVEPGTPLADAQTCNQDKADCLWLAGREALEKSGYGQYEVSNFCLDGRTCRHNIRYWRMLNWLAVGPAASGTIINNGSGTGFRYTIPSEMDAWLAAGGCGFRKEASLPPVVENLDTLTLIKETLLMGFRYIEGPDEELFRIRFHRNIEDCIPETMSFWRNSGNLRNEKPALAREALPFLNRFLIDAFRELDASFSPC